MDDTARAMVGKSSRRTPPSGYPIQIDPEATPPPMEPPPLATLAAMDQGDAIAELRGAIADNTAAIARVWDQRHAAEQLERVIERIDGLMKGTTRAVTLVDEFILPETKKLQGIVGELVVHQERNGALWAREWPQALQRLDAVIARIGAIETSQRDQAREITALREDIARDARATSQRIGTADLRLVAVEGKVAALELARHDKSVGDKRQRRLFGLAVAAVSFLAGVAGGVAALYSKLFGK